MITLDIRDLQKDYKAFLDKEVCINGWVRNHRKQKNFGFIDFYDGTCFKNVQVVYEQDVENFDDIQKIKVGSALEVDGEVIKSEGSGQDFEIKVKN